MNGTDCRGEEHDVTFVWSISSGKRTIIFDGQEVHFSSSRSGIFDYSWTLKNTNHVLKIVAHATPPMSTTPGFRQYDFFVDGSKVNAAPIPFYEAAATSASRFYISKGTNQAGQIIDDVSITATPALEGDFDANGIVDGADFLLWQRDNGVGSLETWKTNFGATAAVAAVSAVPEPTSAMLALGSLLLGIGVRRSALRR